MRLEGKTIINTGASSGIGAAATDRFAPEGGNPVLGARWKTKLAQIFGKTSETGRKAKWLAGDVGHGGYHKALVDLAISEYVGRDGSFNVAGTTGEMAGDDSSFHEWVAGLHALKRMAEPEEIARAALFLLSDESTFVTSGALAADGGNSIYKT
ncbi:enoyl-ACP reductase-like protein [Hoeflea halophila]|uniref:Enoyl-ACP reductase-like protein n=1 Tax=Hoeflea halophila TaxID=714899 RepID=A0A286IDH2_9HYPH|nr:SDR family oxidoreductase [Hoeflea halophila]SOE17389.1 enoyl-ACP reductase-like protein [Hoeflea halophila]